MPDSALLDFIESAPIGLQWLDREGCIIWANEWQLKLLGYDQAEYVGKLFSLFAAEPTAMRAMMAGAALSLKMEKLEVDLVGKSGAPVHTVVHARARWENEKIIHIECYVIDVSAQKKVELALTRQIVAGVSKHQETRAMLESAIREHTKNLTRKNAEMRRSEERYHQMIVEVQDYAIVLLNEAGDIVNWNKGAEKIKGYKAEEIIGKNFRLFYAPEDQKDQLPEKLMRLAYVTGRANQEGWRVRKDGQKFWASVTITALHNEENENIGFVKVTRDLTERKKVDDELRRQALELLQTNKELELMNRELASFAYISSHDLQEPLRKIQTFSSRIMELDGDKFSDKTREYFDRIRGSATRMRALIEDLLSFSRVNTSERKFVMSDLYTIVTDVLTELKETIDERNASVRIDSLPTMRIVPFQVHQLIFNLVSNALKFVRPNQTPVIAIASAVIAGSAIEHPAADSGRTYHRISVRDNGIGFDPEYATKIFEVFQRLHNRDEYAGTGIGLAICKKIAENHGGFITAQSAPDSGSEFQVYLPEV